MQPQKVAVSLPRFKFAAKYQLLPSLTTLGMGVAFSHNADFSETGVPNLCISSVIQATTFNVEEEGTMASAATVAVFRTKRVELPPVILNVNHPFFFAIQDSMTGLILFDGVINNPNG
jgi:serpin B